VDRLAERIAKFEVNAVMRAKQCVLRAEKGIVEDLLAEQLDFVELIKVLIPLLWQRTCDGLDVDG
jgi:hypothetical protein